MLGLPIAWLVICMIMMLVLFLYSQVPVARSGANLSCAVGMLVQRVRLYEARVETVSLESRYQEQMASRCMNTMRSKVTRVQDYLLLERRCRLVSTTPERGVSLHALWCQTYFKITHFIQLPAACYSIAQVLDLFTDQRCPPSP